MKFKKFSTGLLMAAMAMSLVACGRKEENVAETPAAKSDAAGEEVVINLMMSNSQEIGVSAAVEAFNKAYEGKIRCEADYVSFSDVFETLEVLMSNQSTEYDHLCC